MSGLHCLRSIPWRESHAAVCAVRKGLTPGSERPILDPMIGRRKRVLRVTLGILGAFLGMLLLAVAGLFRPLDLDATPQRAGLVSQSAPASSPLQAGWARVRLTPQLGAAQDDPLTGTFRQLPLAGYGQRQGAPATGVHDELWVKAVAFASGGNTGVVITADALIIPREVGDAAAETLRNICGLNREHIYFGATHTHCSLGGWGQRFVGEAFAGPFHPGVRVWFAQQLAEAARSALSNLEPAEIGPGSFAAPEFVRNRLVGERGPVDPEFSVLLVRQADGDRAVVGSYGAHATVLGGDVMQFSGDYPGAWQRAVEASGVQLAAFLAGGVGSQSPRPPQGGFDGAEAMGRRLAEKTVDQLSRIQMEPSGPFAVRMATVDLPDLQVRVTDSVRLSPWAGRQMMPPLNPQTFLQAFQFGSRIWLSTPCDYSGELALELKAAARSMNREAVVTSFNGDYVGYVIPSKYYSMDGYEPRIMNFYGRHVPDVFANTLVDLVRGDSGKP